MKIFAETVNHKVIELKDLYKRTNYWRVDKWTEIFCVYPSRYQNINEVFQTVLEDTIFYPAIGGKILKKDLLNMWYE